ncbi:MAG: translation initiation factor IF-2 [Candidatus Caldatribacteriota bacterium]|nr:translation initiation factor IF-2 [Atribacterota bacterium]MDD3031357.1 translation initiation factor IF-2 [Atribacterota bacterium]MDD3640479.1 translation initiation factor IF-2 [Atribacterota bacterium]MDD4288711.1 translation initiation factor IF-2 [Atribacterota bacterium]MDD4765203.1 translation initiation factor IF-2 [Atribacterota bacterium]
MKKRVYEVAEILKIPTKELIVFLKKEGINVKNHMSTLDDETIEIIQEAILEEGKKENISEKEKKKAIVLNKIPSLKDLSKQLKIPLTKAMQQISKYGSISSVDKELPWSIAKLLYEQHDYDVDISSKLKKELKSKNISEVKHSIITKSPVITIVGHVDHGKTTLLDMIRKTNVTKQEEGGITQQIGAYVVNLKKNRFVFIDTPGHEAFTSMRARGVKATDIVVLVVAADDGIMPQTVEAINHAKAANVPIIVAINKIDKANANIERVKKDLSKYQLVPEDWGGDTLVAEISALQGKGINELLELISIQAEMLELKASPDLPASGIIIETKLDKRRGILATVLIQDGHLNVGDYFVVGTAYGKVKSLMDDNGNNVKFVGPSTPVEITGFNKMPAAGDIFQVVADDNFAKTIIGGRELEEKRKQKISNSKVSLDNLFEEMTKGKIKELNVILKSDTQGSLDAIKGTLSNLGNEEVDLKVIHDGIGTISETDIMLASASNALVVGFNVNIDANAQKMAKKEDIDIRTYGIIYDLIDEIKAALKGYLKPKLEEVINGRAEVREIFKIPKIGIVAGCYVIDGKLSSKDFIRVMREDNKIYEGKEFSLKRFKEDVKEVNAGYECGVNIDNIDDIQVKDIIIFYNFKEVKR